MLQATRWGPASGGVARRLVVLVHGLGASGADLIDLAPYWGQALPNTVFSAPDAPQPCDFAPFGRQWWSVADRDPARMAEGAAAACPALDAYIDAELDRLSLPPDAYALMGFSQGAMMVLYAGLRRATPPRAILAFSGALLAPSKLPERTNSAPILLVHGEDDDVVPASRSHDALTSLQEAGIPVEALFIPGLGHSIDEQGLATGAATLRRVFQL